MATSVALTSKQEYAEMPSLAQSGSPWRRVLVGRALAAGVALLVVVAIEMLLVGPSAPAFAQVIENVKKATSVSFTTTEYFDPAPNHPEKEQSKWDLQGKLVREEKFVNKQGGAKEDEPERVRIRIVDAENKSLLEINFQQKRVRKVQLSEAKAEVFSTFIDSVSTLSEKDAEPAGEEILNGVKTQVYRLRKLNPPLGNGKELEERNPAKIWVDAKTGLPVQIVIDHPVSNARKIVMDKFVWNKPIDPIVFQPEIPEGFQLMERQGSPGRK